MGATFRIRISPEDVGRRVTIRSRIPAGPGEPRHTDTIGTLRSWSDGILRVERRDGITVELDAASLVGARVVGPPPVRRSGHRPQPPPSRPEADHDR